jgi:hypothetical protein
MVNGLAGRAGNKYRQVIAKLHTLVVERLNNRILIGFVIDLFSAGMFRGHAGFLFVVLHDQAFIGV